MDGRFRSLSAAVVKLTNRCNIRCKYCYENIVVKGMDMSSEVFQRMVRAMLSSSAEDRFLLILHGGEPTVLPVEWFEENLGYARDLAAVYSKHLQISIQSNLIDVDEEKLRVFRTFGVSVGGSLDNPAFLKGMQRPLAEKALHTYRKAKALGVQIGILSTINASNMGAMKEFCTWLLHTLNVRHFKANVAYPVGAGSTLLVPTAEAIFSAQRAIIEFMLDTHGALLEENLSLELIRFFENYHGGKDRPGSLCDDKRCGAGSKVVGVTPDGHLLPCGRFAWSDSPHFLGALDEAHSAATERFFERVDHFHESNPENWRACGRCEAAAVCGFGCQAFIIRSRSQINIECEPTQLRFAYYQQNIERLQELYEKICARKQRPAMSRFDQKLAKLQRLLPLEYHPMVQQELTHTLQSRLDNGTP